MASRLQQAYEGEKSALETELKFHRDLYVQHVSCLFCWVFPNFSAFQVYVFENAFADIHYLFVAKHQTQHISDLVDRMEEARKLIVAEVEGVFSIRCSMRWRLPYHSY